MCYTQSNPNQTFFRKGKENEKEILYPFIDYNSFVIL